MKRVNILIFLSLTLLSSICFGGGGAREEAERLFETMGMEKAFQDTVSKIVDMQIQQDPTMAPYRSVALEFFGKHMSYESIKPDMAVIYAEVFTEQELKELNKFYATETGKKTIQMMPELMERGGQLGMDRVRRNFHELQEMIDAETQRILKMQSK